MNTNVDLWNVIHGDTMSKYREAVERLLDSGATSVIVIPPRSCYKTAYREAVARLINRADRDWVHKMLAQDKTKDKRSSVAWALMYYIRERFVQNDE